VLFEKEKPIVLLIKTKAMIVNNGVDIMLLYLKISGIFIFKW